MLGLEIESSCFLVSLTSYERRVYYRVIFFAFEVIINMSKLNFLVWRRVFKFVTCFVCCASVCSSVQVEVDPKKSLIWGPGLKSHFNVPVRYFYIQALDADGRK